MKANQILSARDPAMRDSTSLQSQTNPPHRILVVEDDISVRGLDAEVLWRCGYEVDTAEDGAAGWVALQANDYDLMITDNNMPNLSGVELLKKLRSARMKLPVIMATGTLPTEEFTRYPWCQPTTTLVKPYTIEQLLQTVRKVLREADSTTDAPRQRPAHSPPRILAVDEDSDLRRLYAEALAVPGYHVDVAEDGAAGWEALQANNYNLLITEHDLPRLTGVELVRKLRAAHLALPTVMAAGRLPTDELARNPSLQLAATLMKPFAMDALLDTVENVLRATDRPRKQIAPLPIWQSQPAVAGWEL
jgi:DNA-binding response OmpR family regulator